MPFKSEKQKRYLYANEPALAAEWSSKYGGKVQGKKKSTTKKKRKKK